MRRRRDKPEDADPSPRGLSRPGRSPVLLVTGALMILTLFVLANPWFGVRTKDWPWEAFFGANVAAQPGGLRTIALTSLWLLTGLWAFLFSLRGPVRLRAMGLATFSTLLLLLCDQGGGPFPLVTVTAMSLIPVVLLGAGLWLARSPRAHGTSRFLAGCGAFLVGWALISGWGVSPNVSLGAYQGLLDDVGSSWKEHFAPPEMFWRALLPQSLILLSAAFGVLVALGLSLRRTTTLVFFLLLVGVWMPPVAAALSGNASTPEGAALAGDVMGSLLGAGTLLWLLAVFSVADLVLSRPGQDELEFGL